MNAITLATIDSLCKAIQSCYDRELSGLDDETLQHLIDLGDMAEQIVQLIDGYRLALQLLKDLDVGYCHFDITGTEQDDGYVKLKQKAIQLSTLAQLKGIVK